LSAERTFIAHTGAGSRPIISLIRVFRVWIVRSQAYAEPAFAVFMRASFELVADESALPEPHPEHLLSFRLLSGIVAPHPVLLIERGRRG
jgi:hypothetical protein